MIIRIDPTLTASEVWAWLKVYGFALIAVPGGRYKLVRRA